MLTIIVTAYNIEEYIDKCLQTVCGQTNQNIEVLVVDDGSTDSTLSICKEYEHRDNRVEVLHQNNQGIISARKKGVLAAKGDCITFVDGDDWLEPDIFEKMIPYISDEIDLITAGMYVDYEDHTVSCFDYFQDGLYDQGLLDTRIIPEMAWIDKERVQGILSSVCNKIFKRELLIKVLENIDERITDGEDAAIVYPYLLCSKKIYISKTIGYHYVQRKGSMLHNNCTETFERISILNEQLRRTMLFENKLLERQIKGYLSYHIIPALKEVYNIKPCDLIKTFKLPPLEAYYGKRVVVYGGGEKGNYYVDTIKNIGETSIVLWVDKNADSLGDWRIVHPARISTCRFDIVIIAINNKEICNEVKLELINAGVDEDSIIF